MSPPRRSARPQPRTDSISLAFLAALALGALLALGCSAPAGSEQAPSEAAGTDTDAVAYEPAFPEEVSAEPLTDDDVQQQESAHGDDHAHGEDSHTHEKGTDEDSDHEHSDGGHSH
jgi:hypothetical protein